MVDQGDPVRKQETHVRSEKRLVGKEGDKEKERNEGTGVLVQGSKDHGRMIEASCQKTKWIIVYLRFVKVAAFYLDEGKMAFYR